MSDIKNIRLTDFIQGLQEEDTLDYPNNAVRAGSNVTLAETIQTRGGLSTVDSVGLPAGSEIMSLAQVRFPTNEKTFLIAQVKTEEAVATDIIQPTRDEGLFVFGPQTSSGAETSALSAIMIQGDIIGDGSGMTTLFLMDLPGIFTVNPSYRAGEIVDASLDSDPGYNGVAQILEPSGGVGLKTYFDLDPDYDIIESTKNGPYLYFPDADTEKWRNAIMAESIEVYIVFFGDPINSGTDYYVSTPWKIFSYSDGELWLDIWYDPTTTPPQYKMYSPTIVVTSQYAGGANPLRYFAPEIVYNQYQFSFESDGLVPPYLAGTNNTWKIGDYDEQFRLSSESGIIKEVQIEIDGSERLHLEFGANELTDTSGQQGEGSLSSGTFADIQEDNGISLTTGQYIYFPNQVDTDWWRAVFNSLEWYYKVVLYGKSAEDNTRSITISGDLTHTGYEIEIVVQAGLATITKKEFGSAVSTANIPINNLPYNVGAVIEITSTYDEYMGEPIDTVKFSTPAEDLAVSYSWSLYAMPDTLPDTGA